MSSSLYFYDLETSGISPRASRIMQFAGQRTDLNLLPIGEPDNILIKLTPDILPDPEAILITGITPQTTLIDGISEAEFLKYFYENIATKDTTFVGYNTIRFDDEFMRFLNYRNFYDAYEWQWQDGRGKWDILDLVRMTRALRPEGIKWPVSSEGKATNRLELLASINKLEHKNAHDALSDVKATIAVAGLIKSKQPKLYNYLFSIKDKKSIEKIVISDKPFVYTSGRYPAEYEKTTVVTTICNHPSQKGNIFVYDLKVDPELFISLSPQELSELLKIYKPTEDQKPLPIKQLQFNRCPAVAPLNVLNQETNERLNIDMKMIEQNYNKLLKAEDFKDKIIEAITINEKYRQTQFTVDVNDVDSQLYDGFFNDSDKNKMRVVRAANQESLADLSLDFDDDRLQKLLLLYKARQFVKSLNEKEQISWNEYLHSKLLAGDQDSALAKYFKKIEELSQRSNLTQKDIYLLEELKLYGESLLPSDI